MPAQFTKSISLGSNKVGTLREAAYLRAAGGNLSRWLCSLADRELGLKLPLPSIGRPSKPSERPVANDGITKGPRNKAKVISV